MGKGRSLMPLLGLVDPSHTERKADEPGRVPRWYTTEELLLQASEASPKWSPWPYELINAALDEWQERDYISTTMLVGGCGRSKVIERKEPFILALDDLWAAFRGTMIHRTLEHGARQGSVAEARFFTSVRVPKAGKVEVSCSPDLVTQRPVAVVDYKAPTDDRSIPMYGYPWRNHVDQLQFNRYIINHAEKWELQEEHMDLPWNPRDLVFEHLYVVYLGSRGPKVIECQKSVEVVFKNGGKGNRKYPDIWSDIQVEDELVPRLTGMVKALAAYPEWPKDLGKYPGFEGPPGWKCPGRPWCMLPICLAKRWPDGLVWEQPPLRQRKQEAEEEEE